MFHEPQSEFLYSAYHIRINQSDGNKILPGTATGFVVGMDNGLPMIVTNRHVIDLNYRQTTAKYKDFSMANFSLTGRRPDDSQYTIEIGLNSQVYYHDDIENDVALISPYVKAEDKQSIHYHFGIEHLADKEIYETIDPIDLVCYSGFPSTHDKYANRPILRSGNIASDPKYNYSWNSEYQGECVAYEGFSSAGASGSPVFAPSRGLRNIPGSRHGYLIGVNAGHIPDQHGHSGISYFYKSTIILEIIAKYKLNS